MKRFYLYVLLGFSVYWRGSLVCAQDATPPTPSEIRFQAETPQSFLNTEKPLEPDTSLRDELPLPGNQNNNSYGYVNISNSCVGWVFGYGLLTYLSKEGKASPKNPAYVYHWGLAARGCRSRGRNGSCVLKDDGSKFLAAFQTISLQGSCSMSDYKNPLIHPLESFVKPHENREFVVRPVRIPHQNIVNSIKKELLDRKPIPCLFRVSQDFRMGREFTNWQKDGVSYRIWDRTTRQNVVSHAMLIIGYNDNIRNGCFEVLNSYGTNFGNNGYVWIDYNFFAEKDPNSIVNNPCCMFAFSYSKDPHPENIDELNISRELVGSGREEAWVRVVDENSYKNFEIPEGISGIKQGDVLQLNPAVTNLKLRSRIDVERGKDKLQTTVGNELGALTEGDAFQVSDLKKVILDKGRRTEYWMKGLRVKN